MEIEVHTIHTDVDDEDFKKYIELLRYNPILRQNGIPDFFNKNGYAELVIKTGAGKGVAITKYKLIKDKNKVLSEHHRSH